MQGKLGLTPEIVKSVLLPLPSSAQSKDNATVLHDAARLITPENHHTIIRTNNTNGHNSGVKQRRSSRACPSASIDLLQTDLLLNVVKLFPLGFDQH